MAEAKCPYCGGDPRDEDHPRIEPDRHEVRMGAEMVKERRKCLKGPPAKELGYG